MTTQTTDRTPVENLHVGDTVRAVIDGPDGVVTDNDRMGWTVVRYEPAHPKADGIMLYKHRKDALYVIREAVPTKAAGTLKPPFGLLTGEQERYFARVQAAIEDFEAGRMTCEQLRSYLRRVSS